MHHRRDHRHTRQKALHTFLMKPSSVGGQRFTQFCHFVWSTSPRGTNEEGRLAASMAKGQGLMHLFLFSKLVSFCWVDPESKWGGPDKPRLSGPLPDQTRQHLSKQEGLGGETEWQRHSAIRSSCAHFCLLPVWINSNYLLIKHRGLIAVYPKALCWRHNIISVQA